MASGFLRRILGGRPALPAHVVEALADLDKLAQSRPTLRDSFDVLAAVLPELFATAAIETAPALSPEKSRDKLIAGIPLLRGEAVAWDRPSLHRRWQGVCSAVAKNREGDAAQKLGRAVVEVDPAALLGEVLAGRPEAVAARAKSLGLNHALTEIVLRLAAYPAVARIAGQLAVLRQGVPWEAGCCPTCGSRPLLGEFRGLDQTRVLRCGLCASGWEFPRLCCPICGNRDHRTLSYFFFEGEENRWRMTTCDECQGCVKMASTLGALSEVQLLVTDAATLHLDLHHWENEDCDW